MNDKKVKLSNLDKMIFPDSKYTKKDIIDYYKKVSKYILPHLKNRPVTLERYPDGITESGFYQKQKSDYFPEWINSYKVNNKDGSKTDYVLINNLDSLIYLANQAVITPHIWLSKKDNINKPDKIVFDLDPAENNYKNLIIIAKEIKKYIESLDLNVFVMNTGSNGLHIIVPINPEFTFAKIHDISKKIAKDIVGKNREIATIEQRKDKREGKVFIDYLRNSYGQTSVTPYAIRPKEKAPIATPLDWEELSDKSFNPQKYTINNIFRRISQKKDPWENIYQKRKSLADFINNE
ncbi:MAG: non-homologous end-joining DNA ligase [Bacillota bacterium]